MLIASVLFDVQYFWIKNNKSESIAIVTRYGGINANVSDDELEADPDVAYTFVINYYQNKDNIGAEMFELKLNYFTDYQANNILSLGIQIINPSKMKFWEMHSINSSFMGEGFFVNRNEFTNSYRIEFGNSTVAYFSTDDGISYKATSTFNEKHIPYIMQIEDISYAFDFNCRTLVGTTRSFGNKDYYYKQSSFDYFLFRVYDAISHIVGGTGTYLNLKLEFEDVFRFFQYNSTTGKFDIDSPLAYSENIIHFKVNYYERGAMVHEDSLFGRIGKQRQEGVIWGK